MILYHAKVVPRPSSDIKVESGDSNVHLAHFLTYGPRILMSNEDSSQPSIEH